MEKDCIFQYFKTVIKVSIRPPTLKRAGKATFCGLSKHEVECDKEKCPILGGKRGRSKWFRMCIYE